MNILPKKSWHVLSKQNIERVRRDEAEAKAKEEEKKQRVEIAEREARLELLRKRVRQREDYDDAGVADDKQQGDSQVPAEQDKHINFFQDISQGVGLQVTNVEHDAEKKAEQEKLEKRIGLLNYLVDKDKSEDPWYTKRHGGEESAKSKHRKELMDPLNDMKHFVAAKKKCLEVPSRPPLLQHKRTVSSDSRLSDSSSSKTHKDKHKKHKRKSKSKDKEKESRIEEMRRQRKAREEAERTRSEAMLRQHHGDMGKEHTKGSGPELVEEMPGRYNSQFNPHLARH